jgi:hypothetical protein
MTTPSPARKSYLSTLQFARLSHACWIVKHAFGDPPYLFTPIRVQGHAFRSSFQRQEYDHHRRWSCSCGHQIGSQETMSRAKAIEAHRAHKMAVGTQRRSAAGEP